MACEAVIRFGVANFWKYPQIAFAENRKFNLESPQMIRKFSEAERLHRVQMIGEFASK